VYSSTPETVDNGTLVKDNLCFCDKREGCVASGVWDLRSCKENVPVFTSLPHLYLADPTYHQDINGMRPDPEKHKISIELEPVRFLC